MTGFFIEMACFTIFNYSMYFTETLTKQSVICLNSDIDFCIQIYYSCNVKK